MECRIDDLRTGTAAGLIMTEDEREGILSRGKDGQVGTDWLARALMCGNHARENSRDTAAGAENRGRANVTGTSSRR